jgi:hypothetical protein
MATRVTIPEVVEDFAAYYRRNPVWGALHIVLSDGNMRRSDIEFCIASAERRGDAEGARLARVLLSMSKTQRLKIGPAAEALVLPPRA